MFSIAKFILFIFLVACSNCSDKRHSLNTVGISGRTLNPETNCRPLLYEIDVPIDWTYREPPLNQALTDTTRPLYEFVIEDEEDEIYITIHNFPSQKIEDRVPPAVQVNRWKQQFSPLDESDSEVINQSFGGFAGLKFQGNGIIKDENKMMVGWIMQLPQESYYSLNLAESHLPEYKEFSADYTIKVVGPTGLVLKHQKEIEAAVRTFRLVRDIPRPI